MSDIDFYRNVYKNPDEYKIAGYDTNRQEIEEEKEYDRLQEKKSSGLDKKNKVKNNKPEKKEIISPSVANYEKVVKTIADFELKPAFRKNIVEVEILNHRKKITLDFLKRVLLDVSRYTKAIHTLYQVQENKEHFEGQEFRDEKKIRDGERKVAHDRLINDLKITLRLINTNFNKNFPEANRFQEERKMVDRKDYSDEELKQAIAMRSYVTFDKAGFIVDYLPKDSLAEREYIKGWSFEIYNELSKLDEDLEKALNEKDLS